jgi:outer membrane biosynthesis protein TonB
MRFRIITFTILSSLAGHCFGEPAIERCDPMPEIVTAVQPAFPPQMHHFYGGSIVVEFVIEKSGTVRDPVIVESSIKHHRVELLYGAVYEAMNTWRYESLSKPCRGRMTIEFKLVD